MQDIKNVIQDLESSDGDLSRAAMARLENEVSPDDVPDLVEALEGLQSFWARNGVALLLADLKASEALPAFVRVAKREHGRNSGTLIYCMQAFDCRPCMADLAGLLCSDNFEQREMVRQIFEDMQSPVLAGQKRAALEILRNELSGSASEERRQYAEEVIGHIEALKEE